MGTKHDLSFAFLIRFNFIGIIVTIQPPKTSHRCIYIMIIRADARVSLENFENLTITILNRLLSLVIIVIIIIINIVI